MTENSRPDEGGSAYVDAVEKRAPANVAFAGTGVGTPKPRRNGLGEALSAEIGLGIPAEPLWRSRCPT